MLRSTYVTSPLSHMTAGENACAAATKCSFLGRSLVKLQMALSEVYFLWKYLLIVRYTVTGSKRNLFPEGCGCCSFGWCQRGQTSQGENSEILSERARVRWLYCWWASDPTDKAWWVFSNHNASSVLRGTDEVLVYWEQRLVKAISPHSSHSICVYHCLRSTLC